MRKLLVPIVAVVGAAVLLLDFAGLLGGHYSYGADEMRAAVEGTWELRTPSRTIAFTVRQAAAPRRASRGWLRSASACGSRSLIRNAGACLDSSDMPLEVHVVAGDPVDADGELRVTGLDFHRGVLDVRLGERHLDASIDAEGGATGARFGDDSVSLVRTQRPGL